MSTPKLTTHAVRTHHTTQIPSITSVTMEIRTPTEGQLKGDTWLHLTHGGITGYESVQLTPEIIEELKQRGWSACAGTPNKWDSLYIPPLQMRNLLTNL